MRPERLAELESRLDKYDASATALERKVYVKSLIYGKHKAGKTTAVAACGKRPRIFAIDDGWSALKDWPEIAEHVDVTQCQGMKHFESFCLGLCNGLYPENDHIIFDPMSKLVREYIQYLQENATPSQADSRVVWTAKPDRTDPEFKTFSTAGMGDYNAVLQYFRKWLYPVFRVKKHITLIAHLREPGITEQGKIPSVRAAFPGQTHDMFCQEMELIGLMEEQRNGERTISFESKSNVEAGSRARALHGKRILASELPMVYEKWGQ